MPASDPEAPKMPPPPAPAPAAPPPNPKNPLNAVANVAWFDDNALSIPLMKRLVKSHMISEKIRTTDDLIDSQISTKPDLKPSAPRMICANVPLAQGATGPAPSVPVLLSHRLLAPSAGFNVAV